VRAGFDVLREAGKLGAVLLQFPFSFHRTAETSAHLSALLKRFADYPLVVELRHASWQTNDTLDFLREHNAGFCNIDQPIIGNSVKPTAQSTSSVGYLRFHGRRCDTWFSDDPKLPAHERYNYLYSPEELIPWVNRIQEVQKHTRDIYVVTNNHYQGKAVLNALQLLSILKGTKLKVPDDLRQHYPQLEQLASEMPAAPALFPLGSPTGKNRRALLLEQVFECLAGIQGPGRIGRFHGNLRRLHIRRRRGIFLHRHPELVKSAIVFRILRRNPCRHRLRALKLRARIEKPALLAAMQLKPALRAFSVGVKSRNQHRPAIRAARARHRSHHPRRSRP
jgi:hypothetical protein